MSGKYEKKGSGKTGYSGLWKTVAALGAMLALVLLVAGLKAAFSGENADPAEQITGDDRQETVDISQAEQTNTFELSDGAVITDIVSYTGVFMEDRTDEIVTDVLAIRVTNTGDEYIQTMDITLTGGEHQARFSVSTLFPGDTVIVLEKNRMACSTAPAFDRAETDAVVLFEEAPGMCEDRLEIQCLDGVINVTNVSGEDITGDILIYYKNYADDLYYGGITYRLRIEGGLKAGQISQGMAAHFNSDNSRVVFVTCE